MTLFLHNLLFVALAHVVCSASAESSVRDVCGDGDAGEHNTPHGAIRKISGYCATVVDGSVGGRCCVRNGTTLIGIDINGWALSSLIADNRTWLFPEHMGSVEWIDASNTAVDVFGGNFSMDAVPQQYWLLKGLISLQEVVLPAGSTCPGPSGAWSQSSAGDTVICTDPVQACSLEGELLYYNNQSACSSTSHCVNYGPGFRQCECFSGFHGYRCLRKGQFSYRTFFWTLAATMLVIIAIPVLRMVHHLHRMRAHRFCEGARVPSKSRTVAYKPVPRRHYAERNDDSNNSGYDDVVADSTVTTAF